MKETGEIKLCPYCGGELEEGFIHGDSSRGVFWLPRGRRLKSLTVYSKKAIERCGGFAIDNTTRFGFFAVKKPVSYYCGGCELLITPLPERKK